MNAKLLGRLALLAAVALAGCRSRRGADANAPPAGPLRIVVMDPLADKLTGDCTRHYAQRKYDELGRFLEKRLGRAVLLAHSESLANVLRLNPGKVHAMIGKESIVAADALQAGVPVGRIACLTGQDGKTTTSGTFVVRAADPAQGLSDLAGRKILFGPREDVERHGAALAMLAVAGVPVPRPVPTSASDNAAALEVMDQAADAAVISTYSLPRLAACGVVAEGDLRPVGTTAPVPFVTVFVTDHLPPEPRRRLLDALLAMKQDPALLEAMESKDGFVAVRPGRNWTDWRGPGRDALSDDVPEKLPEKPAFLWREPMTGVGLSGVAATDTHVLVADKDEPQKHDVWRCLRAADGLELWSLACPAAGKLDYSNSPRANPVICDDGLAYLLGAFGDLHCVRLASGKPLWQTNLARQFGAKLTQWGLCSTPLVVDDKLIVNPGAKDASLVALDRKTGKVIWKSPGRQSAYASFILAAPGGVRQVIGYDATTLGGWDPASGRRLWTLVPKEEGDFNVPTPVFVDGRLLLATENNGTRLYAFDAAGRIVTKPLARNDDLAPDAQTPVVLGRRAFGCCGDLFCLDLAGGLKTLWKAEDGAFEDYAALIAGNGRLLMLTVDGQLLLVRADAGKYQLISRLKLYGQEETEIFSHPALVGQRLYVRNDNSIACVLLR